MDMGSKSLATGISVGVLISTLFAGTFYLGRRSTQSGPKETPAFYLDGKKFYQKDFNNDGRPDYMSADGRVFRKGAGKMQPDGVMNANAEAAKNEILQAIENNNQEKLYEIRNKYSEDYVNAAVNSITSQSGFEEFRKRYARDGVLVSIDLDPKSLMFIELAGLVKDRYELVRQAQQERLEREAEEQRIQQLRDAHGGYPIDQLPPDQVRPAEELLNVRPEQTPGAGKSWQTIQEQQQGSRTVQTQVFTTPEEAQRIRDEKKRQELLNMPGQAIGAGRKTAEQLMQDLQKKMQQNKK